MARGISRHEGQPFDTGRPDTKGRDVFTAEVDWGRSVVDNSQRPNVLEPVFTISGSGERQENGEYAYKQGEWVWGLGTNLSVARSSIPALQRVLADLLEYDPSV